MSNIVWTKEICQKESLKYKTKIDFLKNNPRAYRSSHKNGWLKDICSHMSRKNKPLGYWTKLKCKKEALKYKTKKDFMKSTAYNVSYKNGWLNDICSHMKKSYNSDGYWNKEKCQEETLKYNTRSEFQKNNASSYKISNKNGWLNDICVHMINVLKPKNYWTKDKCREEALKYKTRSEFSKNSSTPYSYSAMNNWLDDICSHMEIIGNRIKRCIYVYEFSNKSAYIGLTYNINNRNIRHIKNEKSPVFKNIENGNFYELKKLSGYIDIQSSQKLENYYVEEYRKNGWKILNKNKTGGLGGTSIKWTKEKCSNESLKYSSRSEFQKNCGSAYNSARKNNWLNDICSHMK